MVRLMGVHNQPDMERPMTQLPELDNAQGLEVSAALVKGMKAFGLNWGLRKGDRIWTDDRGGLHREGGPALESAAGSKEWYRHSERHRLDGPALIEPDGSKVWYTNDVCHRYPGPAAELADGTKGWYYNGDLERVDGPAIEYADGSREWYRQSERTSPKYNVTPPKAQPDGTFTSKVVAKFCGEKIETIEITGKSEESALNHAKNIAWQVSRSKGRLPLETIKKRDKAISRGVWDEGFPPKTNAATGKERTGVPGIGG